MVAPLPPIAVGVPRDPNNPATNQVSEGREDQIDLIQAVIDTNDKLVRTITAGKTFFTYLVIAANQTGMTDTLELFDGPSAGADQKLKLVLADDQTIAFFVGGFIKFTTSIVMLSGNASAGNPMTLTINGVEI